jgi:putative transposase
VAREVAARGAERRDPQQPQTVGRRPSASGVNPRGVGASHRLEAVVVDTGVYLNYHAMDRRMHGHEAYQALPAKVTQWVLRILDKNWQCFFEALAAWQADPSKFLGRPRLPGYKDKQKGRNLLVYTTQALSAPALSAPALRQGVICPSMLGITVKTRRQHIQQVRIIPRIGFYIVEVVYEREPVLEPVIPALHAGIDIGLNNLAMLTSDKPDFVPRVVNGRPVKSINQFYNKRRAELQSQLGEEVHTSRRLEYITTKRMRRIEHYPHTASWRIIELLVAEGIGTLCIGKNPSGSRKRTWADAPIRTLSLCLMPASSRC